MFSAASPKDKQPETPAQPTESAPGHIKPIGPARLPKNSDPNQGPGQGPNQGKDKPTE
jgi:hypothetical protein